MEDQPKFERMLKLLLSLTSIKGFSADELADRFELSQRTVMRYISTFRNAGFVVECSQGLYRIPKVDKPFKAINELLHFSEEEAFILTRAIHSIDDTNQLKTNLINKLYSIYKFHRVVETVVKPDNASVVHSIIEAIENKKQVILRSYSSAHGKIVRDRMVEPFDFTSNYISFWAFEPESMQNKLFKTSRVRKTVILENDQKFIQLHYQYPIDVFRISTSLQLPVKLLLTIRAYNLLIEEYPLAEKYITQVDDNEWQFKANVCSYEGIGRFVIGLLDEIQIVDSDDFKLFIAEKIKKYARLS